MFGFLSVSAMSISAISSQTLLDLAANRGSKPSFISLSGVGVATPILPARSLLLRSSFFVSFVSAFLSFSSGEGLVAGT